MRWGRGWSRTSCPFVPVPAGPVSDALRWVRPERPGDEGATCTFLLGLSQRFTRAENSQMPNRRDNLEQMGWHESGATGLNFRDGTKASMFALNPSEKGSLGFTCPRGCSVFLLHVLTRPPTSPQGRPLQPFPSLAQLGLGRLALTTSQ